MRKLVSFLLEDAGYLVITATDRSSLLQSIEDAFPDLILLDVELPDASGFELCRQIRAVSNIQIMYLSGYAQTDHKVFGLRNGSDDYMAKPLEPAELLARIATLLRHHDVGRQLATSRLPAAGITVDLAAQKVRFDNGRTSQLTPSKTRLLHRLRAKIEPDPAQPRHITTIRNVGYRFEKG